MFVGSLEEEEQIWSVSGPKGLMGWDGRSFQHDPSTPLVGVEAWVGLGASHVISERVLYCT